MNYIAKCFAMLAFIVFGLSACGGESSGSSTGTMTSSQKDTSQLSTQALRGLAIYDGTSCISCHGPLGKGTAAAPRPIDNVQDCKNCTDPATLTAYNTGLMPFPPFSPGSCVGTCAEDVSQYIIEGFIEGKVNPSSNPGITVTPTAGLVTSEAGAMASLTVRLTTQPTADVMIGLTSSIPTEGTVNLASLSFNSVNWNQVQTVTVTGIDDGVVDGDMAYTLVTAPAASADADYNGRDAADVTAMNTDNDVAIPVGITITPTMGLITTEAGTTATFMVSLDSMPSADVTIPISSSNANEGTVNSASLVFTMNDYNLAQTVTITGIDDALADGNIAYMVVTGAATSADSNYSNFNASDVAVTNNDNEVPPTPGIQVNPTSGLMTTEAGGTANFTVVLQSMPTTDVSIALLSADQTEGVVSPTMLVFTSQDWNVPQTAIVTGVGDTEVDGNIAYSVATQAAQSADAAYSNLNAADVALTNMDNDVAVDPGIALGKIEYEKVINGQSCATCHGAQGQGGLFKAIVGFKAGDLAAITKYINDKMPDVTAPPTECLDAVNNCATNIAKYMENGYSAQ